MGITKQLTRRVLLANCFWWYKCTKLQSCCFYWLFNEVNYLYICQYYPTI